VFRLQFDEFQIVSSSHDDTILIWDFLNYNPSSGSVCSGRLPMDGAPNQADTRSPSRKYARYFVKIGVLHVNY